MIALAVITIVLIGLDLWYTQRRTKAIQRSFEEVLKEMKGKK